MDRLVGHALFDQDFGARLLENPRAAAHELGIDLSESQVERIMELEPASFAALGTLFRNVAELEGPPGILPIW